jgi:hypothetical protein
MTANVSNAPDSVAKRPINNVRLPFRLLIIAAILVVIAEISRPIIDGQEAAWKVTYVLVTGLPFILEFIAFILCFAFVIFLFAKWLNNRISPDAYKYVEWFILACVALGLIGMFQPWQIEFYNIGFHLLLFATLAFNVWTHVTPKRVKREEEVTST